MQIIRLEQNTPEWLEWRKNKITGSKSHDVAPPKRGNAKKIGFYQLIADRLAIDDGETSSRDRGHEMEIEALDALEEYLGVPIDRDPGCWQSDLDENIAISPDAGIPNKDGIYTAAAEVKCLGSALHLLAIIENQVPYKYFEQAIQYFVVNENLQKLYFVFYDPRVTSKPLHIIEMEREFYQEQIEAQLLHQRNMLEEVNYWVEKLAF